MKEFSPRHIRCFYFCRPSIITTTTSSSSSTATISTTIIIIIITTITTITITIITIISCSDCCNWSTRNENRSINGQQQPLLLLLLLPDFDPSHRHFLFTADAVFIIHTIIAGRARWHRVRKLLQITLGILSVNQIHKGLWVDHANGSELIG
jgi:hypothetical protein